MRSLIGGAFQLSGLTRIGRLNRLNHLIHAESPEAMHRYHVSQWASPSDLMDGVSEPATPFTDREQWLTQMSPVERLMYVDLVTYLPEDILTKLDRASMAVGLEARVPFLDYRLVELAWRLPLNFKIHERRGKHIIRTILRKYVPPPMFERPKMGFDFPLGQWLRGPLRGWVEELIDPAAMRQQEVFDPEVVNRTWTEHLAGKRNWSTQIWTILMFQAWQQLWTRQSGNGAFSALPDLHTTARSQTAGLLVKH